MSALLSTMTGRHAARPGDREVALEAAKVEVVVEAGDDEGHVDVRGDDLLVGEVARGPPVRVGRAAGERRASGRMAAMTARSSVPGAAADGSSATQSPTAG